VESACVARTLAETADVSDAENEQKRANHPDNHERKRLHFASCHDPDCLTAGVPQT
jgi:hypothetical protein